MYEVVELHI